VDGEAGILLRHEELILRGSGRISFGNPHEEGHAEYLGFSCLD
jgi:hypothetical protein